MSQLTNYGIIKALTSLFSALDTVDLNLVKRFLGIQWKTRHTLTDAATAGTAIPATPVYLNDEPVDARGIGDTVSVLGATLTLPVALTADNSNNATFTLDRVDATGANPATIGTFTNNVAGGAVTAFVKVPLVLTTTNASIPNGWSLRIAVTKGGTGQAITGAQSRAQLEVTLQRDLT